MGHCNNPETYVGSGFYCIWKNKQEQEEHRRDRDTDRKIVYFVFWKMFDILWDQKLFSYCCFCFFLID